MLTTNFALLRQRVEEHVKEDSIIQKIYWNPVTMRGCFIGCLARNENSREATFYNEKTYGLPIPLQRIAENIFEGLQPVEAKNFFASLPEAIGQDGKDLSKVHWKFLASELRSIPQQSVKLQRVIDQVIDGLELLSRGMQWSEAEAASKAAWAAARAAVAAGAAARAAARAAEAARAAGTAETAADWAAVAAEADAYAAKAAAQDADKAAAGVAARIRQRDLLLQLIKEAPVKQSY